MKTPIFKSTRLILMALLVIAPISSAWAGTVIIRQADTDLGQIIKSCQRDKICHMTLNVYVLGHGTERIETDIMIRSGTGYFKFRDGAETLIVCNGGEVFQMPVSEEDAMAGHVRICHAPGPDASDDVRQDLIFRKSDGLADLLIAVSP